MLFYLLLFAENVAHAATTVNLTKEPTRIKTIKLTEAIDCETIQSDRPQPKVYQKFKGSKKLEKRAAKQKTILDGRWEQ